MNAKWYIAVIIFSAWLSAFTFHDDLIPLTFNGETLDKPFLGGFNRPKIQWLDWDADGDLDLFILDASGYLRYLQNQGTTSIADFHLLTTSYQDVFCGGWFYFADFDNDGDLDLTAQNGDDPDHISYFQNTAGELAFIAVLAAIDGEYVSSSSVMTPTFADIDNDGDLDFFTGNMVGTLTYYENIGFSSGDIPQFDFVTNSWQDIYIVGGTRIDDRHGDSAITFIDLDSDDTWRSAESDRLASQHRRQWSTMPRGKCPKQDAWRLLLGSTAHAAASAPSQRPQRFAPWPPAHRHEQYGPRRSESP